MFLIYFISLPLYYFGCRQATHEKSLSELQTQLAVTKETSATIHSQLDKLEKEKALTTTANANYLKEIADLKKQLSDKISSITNFESQIQKDKLMISKLQKQLDELTTKTNADKAAIIALESKYTDFAKDKVDFDKREAELEAATKVFNAEKESLHRLADNATMAKSLCDKTIIELRAQLKKETVISTELKSKVDQLEIDLNKKYSSHDEAVNAKIAAVEEQARKDKEEVNAARKQLADMNKFGSSTITDANKRLAEAELKAKQDDSEISSLRLHLGEMTLMKVKCDERFSKLENQMNVVVSERDALKVELDAVKKKATTVSNAVSGVNSKSVGRERSVTFDDAVVIENSRGLLVDSVVGEEYKNGSASTSVSTTATANTSTVIGTTTDDETNTVQTRGIAMVDEEATNTETVEVQGGGVGVEVAGERGVVTAAVEVVERGLTDYWFDFVTMSQ